MWEFDLYYQYTLYLQRVNLQEHLMTPQQQLETKRAFMGACGQMLQLLCQDIQEKSESTAANILENMARQIDHFFQVEIRDFKTKTGIIVDPRSN